jgi:hypothetical protein
MALLVSPGVNTSEIDLTASVPAVGVSSGATVGTFRWGPANTVVQVSSESDLLERFFKPDNNSAVSFLSSANFLAYGNDLRLVRVVRETAGTSESTYNAVGVESANISLTVPFASVEVNVSSNLVFANLSALGGSDAGFLNLAAGDYVVANGETKVIASIANANAFFVTSTFTNPGTDKAINTAVIRPYSDGLITTIALSTTGVEVNVSSTLVIANTGAMGAAVNAGFHLLQAGDYVTVNSASVVVASVLANANGFLTTTSSINPATDIAAPTSALRPGTFTKLVTNDTVYSTTDYLSSNSSVSWVARYPGKVGNSLKVSVCASAAAYSGWPYALFFDSAPGTSNYASSTGLSTAQDEMHIVVVDEDGQFSGTANTVLERFAYVSKATDAKGDDGSNIYYKDAIYRTSKYIHWLGHPDNASMNAANTWGQTVSALVDAGITLFHSPATVKNYSLRNAADGKPSTADYTSAWDLFENKETYDVSLLFGGDFGYSANASIDTKTLTNNLLDIVEARKDSVAFVSPTYANSVTSSTKVADVVADRGGFNSTSYGVMDSGWKYQYDKYNDTYRWVPLNADIAGLCVRTDTQRDPWFSPAGVNRGQIRNVVKLSFTPSPGERDTLYKNGVNPVVGFPGEGTILYGDKTMQGRSSAFDRINVRRLFIVLEKAISQASRQSLFEFNDEFTRAQFVALVEPFLRDIQGRRGIYDFRVVCDETNNSPSVIDRNEFVGDIYVKPARSINFIQLNFVAVRSGVAFDEIVGRF